MGATGASSGAAGRGPGEGGDARTPLLVVCGPTATGKSAVGIDLALRLGGEIISADSMQVYRGMDIGTAKPTLEERRGVPHHLIDVRDPDEDFSVAEYQVLAREAIRRIRARGRLPIVVGGTGLYIRALVENYSFVPHEKDPGLRRELLEEAGRRGSEALHRRLARIDPDAARSIHPNDVRRIVRALEIHSLAGARPSALRSRGKGAYHAVVFGLTARRKVLYAWIERRVERMLERGLVDEVRRLLSRGYGNARPMEAIGYRHVTGYLCGRYSFEEACRLMKRDTRHYARRQLIWFRRDERVRWLDVERKRREALVEEIVRNAEGEWTEL